MKQKKTVRGKFPISQMKKQTNTTDQTLSDIMRGMQRAVNTAQEALQDYQFRLMKKYFREDGSPYTVWITLSDGRRVEVPQITLLPWSLIAIEELEMGFSVEVSHSELKKQVAEAVKGTPSKPFDDLTRSSFIVQFARQPEGEAGAADGNAVTVRIKFKAIPVPEGTARMLDALNMDIVEKASPVAQGGAG